MKMLLKMGILTGLFSLSFVGFLHAEASDQPVDVGNRVCPVSGAPVNDEDSYVYQGKKYQLCSSGCAVPFASSPEKYIGVEEPIDEK